MPRLFAALALPYMVTTQLSFLRGGFPGARFIDPENYHLTVRFFGDVENHIADEIVSELDRIKRAPFALQVNGLDVFGGKKPRTLFATIAPSTELNELNADIERICQRLCIAADKRKFTPHITLARLKDVTPERAARFLANCGAMTTPPFTIPEFALYSSRDSIGGGPYVREEAFALETARPDRSLDYVAINSN